MERRPGETIHRRLCREGHEERLAGLCPASKPVGINKYIGRQPIAAFGNSDGDQQMLEWTQGGSGARLMMLVHHDDAVREWAYGVESKIGTFSDALMAEAKAKKWTVISMKNERKRIFPFDK